MNTIIKVTTTDGEKVLIGVPSIITAKKLILTEGNAKTICTKIELRHAMVTSVYAIETIEEIYTMINSKTKIK